ncbi:MAG: hypothetical protein V3V00_08675 [Saprospiraceae bacterium]
MRKSKLFDLLRSLEKEEWKSFRSFLLSRHKEGTEMILLYDYISKYKGDWNHKYLDKDRANSLLFKKKSNKNFLNLMHQLRTEILDYFAWEDMQRDPRDMNLHTLKSLNRRGLFLSSTGLNNHFQKSIDKSPIDLWNSWYQLQANHILKFSDNPIKAGREPELWKQMAGIWHRFKTHLDLFYQADAMNIMKLYPDNLSTDISELVPGKSDLADDFIANILRDLVAFTVSDDQDLYMKIFDTLIDGKIQLTSNFGGVVLDYLINYNIRKAKKGQGDYVELFRLYDFGLNTGLLFDNGEISDSRFLVAVELASLEEVKMDPMAFIDTWSSSLNKETRDDVILLARSSANIYGGRAGHAIAELNQYKFSNPRHQNSMRILLLMADFTDNYDNTEFLNNQLRNFYEYTKRHEKVSSPLHYEAIINFCKILRMIANRGPLGDVIGFLAIDHPLVKRLWLYTYIDKIKEVDGH